ncbi:Scr1 family TA system antitoxin-like transcriptional regulator [Kitasatospora purpeofusca]|uniref:Scr1 family TA system antitoxin-like transcriptional regulator n=1 Tax=Kitasatospora purpeofusca TaxID=67352 RepID=UPI003813315A
MLRDLRTAAGYPTHRSLALEMHVSESFVQKVEGLERQPRREFAESCDTLFGTGGQLTRVWDDVDWATVDHPDWFRQYAAKEQECTRLRQLQMERVPGLLQTASYARALFRHLQPEAEEDEIERGIQARLRRQDRFLAADGPEYVAIVDEGVIWQQVGGRMVMHAQLAHLLAITETHPRVFVHIAQRELGERTGAGGFSLLALPDGNTWAYSESLDRGLFVTDPEAVEARSRAYDRLRADALNAPDSAQLIRRAMRELVNVASTPFISVPWRQPREWKISTYSQGNGGDCIEAAPGAAAVEGVVPVRDSKDRSGPELGFSPAAWQSFVQGVAAGDFGTV